MEQLLHKVSTISTKTTAILENIKIIHKKGRLADVRKKEAYFCRAVTESRDSNCLAFLMFDIFLLQLKHTPIVSFK